MSDSNPDFGQIAEIASTFGEQKAGKVLEQVIRRAALDIFSTYSADDLRECIDEDYPLAERELPAGAEQALREVGPQFEDHIIRLLTPEQVMAWMADPTWVDDPRAASELKRCHDVIAEHPDGDEWLLEQVKYVRNVTLDYPDDGQPAGDADA